MNTLLPVNQIDESGQLPAENSLEYTNDVHSIKWPKAFVRSGVEEFGDTRSVKNTIPNCTTMLKKPIP